MTNSNTRTVLNNPNPSLLWDSIDLPATNLLKSTNPRLGKEATRNEGVRGEGKRVRPGLEEVH